MAIVTCQKCNTKNRVTEGAGGSRRPVCGKCGAPLEASSDSGRPVHVTDSTFASIVAASVDKPLLVDCWAPWCGPCRVVGPIMDQLSAESEGRYTIGKLNVDENPRTAAEFRIQSIPTMLIFKGGQLVDRIVGSEPKPAIVARLARFTSN